MRKQIFIHLQKKFLVDVRTGTGVIGKKPDIKWRRNPRDIIAMPKLQLQILQNISNYLEIEVL